ncbi:MAG: nitroreductase family protein [Candidatus Norongarragalinales archaeon]
MQAIRERRSVRSWSDKPIPRSAVKTLKEAASWAPSAGNLQSRKFFFVTEKSKITALCEATARQFPPRMPLIVVACADYASVARYGERGRTLYALLDVAAAVENLLLAAHSLGLGGVWVGAFDEDAVRAALSIPAHLRPVTLVPLGFPSNKEKPLAPPRKREDELFQDV